MSDFHQKIIALVAAGKVAASQHGFARLDKRGILFADIVGGVDEFVFQRTLILEIEVFGDRVAGGQGGGV